MDSPHELWRRALFKIKVQRVLTKLKEELLLFGTSHDLADQDLKYKPNIDQLLAKKQAHLEDFRKQTTSYYIEQEGARWMLRPDQPFLQVWQVLISLLLLYAAVVMPYRVAFAQEVYWDAWSVLELSMDLVFLGDVLVTFLSVRIRPDGSVEAEPRVVARQYLQGWLLLDIVASVPYTLCDYFLLSNSSAPNARYNTLLRLARVPRLYRLLRLLRLFKAFRRQGALLQILQDVSQVNLRLSKLIKFCLALWAAVHVAACGWYFVARASDFEPDTWVARDGCLDSSDFNIYLRAFYWAVSTMVTVGYGDVTAKTSIEQGFALVWMLVGAGFFSFAVGSLSSFFMSIDTLESVLAAKVELVHELSEQTGLSQSIQERILAALRFNAVATGAVWNSTLFQALPKALKAEAVGLMFGGVAKSFPFFARRDPAFGVFVVPRLKPLHCHSGFLIYQQGEYADGLYFITRGRVTLVLSGTAVMYKAYVQGSYVGEIELFRGGQRQDTMQAYGATDLLILEKPDFHQMCAEFPVYAKEIMTQAAERERRNRQALLETQELLRLRNQLGSLQQLAGRAQVFQPLQLADLTPEACPQVQTLQALARQNKADMQTALALLSDTQIALQRFMQLSRTSVP